MEIINIIDMLIHKPEYISVAGTFWNTQNCAGHMCTVAVLVTVKVLAFRQLMQLLETTLRKVS